MLIIYDNYEEKARGGGGIHSGLNGLNGFPDTLKL